MLLTKSASIINDAPFKDRTRIRNALKESQVWLKEIV
jgi:hypothetical protein